MNYRCHCYLAIGIVIIVIFIVLTMREKYADNKHLKNIVTSPPRTWQQQEDLEVKEAMRQAEEDRGWVIVE